MAQKIQPYALVTGASSGIGKAIAEELASQKHPIILVSLPNEGLDAIAAEMSGKYGVDVRFFEGDLSKTENQHAVYDWTVKEGLPVNILVNNAGLGDHGPFNPENLPKYQVMMGVNSMAMLTLTTLFLPAMKKMPEAYVLNNASSAAFFPVPFKAVYSATKAFMKYLSIALNRELKGTNVKVCCLCPGAVITSDAVKARIDAAGWLSRKTAMTSEDCARRSVRLMKKGHRLIIPGFMTKFIYFLGRVLPPGWSLRITENTFRKQSKKGYV